MAIARRSFIAGLIGLVVAPAIVKASSLMPSYTSTKDDIIALIDSSHQTGFQLTTWSALRKIDAGDIVTIDGVYAVNSLTGKNIDYLRQFVITHPSEVGFKVHNIYPMVLNFHDCWGNRPTVDNLPRANAAIRLVSRDYSAPM